MAFGKGCGIFVLILATVGLVLIVLSTSLIRPINLVYRDVTIDNVNATLAFGTLGYCITMSNDTNATCSDTTPLYEIS